MSLPTVSYYDYPRNLLTSDYNCPICYENIDDDKGKLWVGHPDPAEETQTSPDPTKLRHILHKKCAINSLVIRTQCGYNDAVINTKNLCSSSRSSREKLGIFILKNVQNTSSAVATSFMCLSSVGLGLVTKELINMPEQNAFISLGLFGSMLTTAIIANFFVEGKTSDTMTKLGNYIYGEVEEI